MEWVFRDYRISLNQEKDPLPIRDDVVEFDIQTNAKDFENNLKLHGWPSDLQEKVKEVVTDYWDVFCEDGFRRPIRGFSFQIDTSNHPYICWKPPRYVPHESEVIRKLAERLDKNGVLGEDYRPWGALLVLASKPNQENVPQND